MENKYEKVIKYLGEIAAEEFYNFLVSIRIGQDVVGTKTPEELEEIMRLGNIDVYSKYCELKNAAMMINSLSISECKELFNINELAQLSHTLMSVPLKSKERVQIILDLFENNIAWLEEYNNDMNEYNVIAQNISEKELSPSMTLLTEVLNMLDNYANSENQEFAHLKETMLKFKEHYFDKLDSYDINDIEILINLLEEEQFEPSLCESMKSIMIKNISKRDTKEIKITIINSDEDSQKSKLSNRERKRLYYEIQTYFNLDEMKAIRTLSLEEIIMCTSLLIQLEMPMNKIVQIINIIEKANRSRSENPFALYNEIYEKLQYYGLNGQLPEYIRETFIVNDDDYAFWKDTTSQELSEVMNQIPNTYEFEIEKAKSLVKI